MPRCCGLRHCWIGGWWLASRSSYVWWRACPVGWSWRVSWMWYGSGVWMLKGMTEVDVEMDEEMRWNKIFCKWKNKLEKSQLIRSLQNQSWVDVGTVCWDFLIASAHSSWGCAADTYLFWCFRPRSWVQIFLCVSVYCVSCIYPSTWLSRSASSLDSQRKDRWQTR